MLLLQKENSRPVLLAAIDATKCPREGDKEGVLTCEPPIQAILALATQLPPLRLAQHLAAAFGLEPVTGRPLRLVATQAATGQVAWQGLVLTVVPGATLADTQLVAAAPEPADVYEF